LHRWPAINNSVVIDISADVDIHAQICSENIQL
jgi:hypothetical protein